MNQKKAKAIRRLVQDLHGGTKAKQHFRRRDNGQIIGDEARLQYQNEKRSYKSLPRKLRAGRYLERNDLP